MALQVVGLLTAFGLFSVLVWSCGDTGSPGTDAGSAVAHPWPTVIKPLPPCKAHPGGFVDPKLAAPVGLVHLNLSARLQPVGTDERVLVEIRRPVTGEPDTGFSGEVLLKVGKGVRVVRKSSIVAGRGEAVLRFETAGRHTIHGSLAGGDLRDGSVEVLAYQTQLPVWEVSLAEGDLQKIIDNPGERTKLPAGLTAAGTRYKTDIRIHGGSSKYYYKKSFRLDLASKLTLPDGRNHLILRAEWRDKTMLRNYLGMELLRNGTWLPTPTTEMVHLRINGRYYGVMWLAERIDGDFLARRGLHNGGSLYEADPPEKCRTIGGDLAPVDSLETYRCIYQQHKGGTAHTDLIDLISVTLMLPQEKFATEIWKKVNVTQYVLWMAAMAVIQNHDHIKKNYYLYRNPMARDSRWIVIPWDLDLTFGHLWTEEKGLVDERIFTDGSLYFGRCPGFCNRLMDRLWRTPEIDRLFNQFVERLTHHTFTREFIDSRIRNAVCRATPDLLADRNKRASNAEYLGRVDELRSFVDKRRALILSGRDSPPTQ